MIYSEAIYHHIAPLQVHINNISVRNYVQVESNRRLVPTKLGIALIRGYWRVDPELIQPTMRADVERQLELIAKGRADYRAVLEHTLAHFRRKFEYFTANVGEVDGLFSASFTALADSGKPFTRCGKCRRYMKLVATKPQRLYCPNCEETYAIPPMNGGSVRPVDGEKTCPLDEFGLVYLAGIGGKLARSFEFCPHCYNQSPFEDMPPKGAGCNQCTHPTCPHSLRTQGVVGCLNGECRGGVLVLDPQSGSKWRLACNKCPSVVGLFEGAAKVKVLSGKECVDCGALLMHAEYRVGLIYNFRYPSLIGVCVQSEKDSKLPSNALTYDGCIFCEHASSTADPTSNPLLNLNHAKLTKEVHFGGGRRGGRGGRGGRGRGQGGWRSRVRGMRGDY